MYSTLLEKSRKMPSKTMFYLIEWREDPPKWDVVKEGKILSKEKNVGDIVDVEFKDESGPATILNKDRSEKKLLKDLAKLEEDYNKEEESKLPEKRERKKNPKFLETSSSDDSNDERENEQQPKKKAKVLQSRKTHDMMSWLSQLIMTKNTTDSCSSCQSLQCENESLAKELSELRALNFKLQKEMLSKICQPTPGTPSSSSGSRSPVTPVTSTPSRNKHSSGNMSDSSGELDICSTLGIVHRQLMRIPKARTPTTFLRDVATMAFGREELSTHSLKGQSNKCSKPALPVEKVVALFDLTMLRYPDANMKDLKAALRAKLNDEHKLAKRREVANK